MTLLAWLLRNENRLDLVAGLCDGIQTSLILAAGRVLNPAAEMDPSLVLRVAAVAGFSSVFVFFVGHYALLRSELVEAERQLNLASRGRLATSRLGRAALIGAAQGAGLASVFSFCGALLPLVVGVLVPDFRWIAVAVSLLVLAVLGVILARSVRGHPLRWAGGLLAGGALLTYLGTRLNIA
jgi:VIT1/CCC1 family predicted Fe2+/Mn2+ transporter